MKTGKEIKFKIPSTFSKKGVEALMRNVKIISKEPVPQTDMQVHIPRHLQEFIDGKSRTSRNLVELLRRIEGSFEGPLHLPPRLVPSSIDDVALNVKHRGEKMDSEETNLSVRGRVEADSRIEDPIDKLEVVFRVMSRQDEISSPEDLQRIYNQTVIAKLNE
jgi:hypothetical protein